MITSLIEEPISDTNIKMVSPITQHESIPVYAKDQKDLNKIIGRNVAALRKATKMSQKDFFEIIGLAVSHKYPSQYFSKLTRGEVGMSIYTLLIIQKTFTVTLEQLLTPNGVSEN